MRFYFFNLFFLTALTCMAQSDYAVKTDSLLAKQSPYPFNGIIIIAQQGKTIYKKTAGYSDLKLQTKIKDDDQFVIGSISKQITAVLVLREMDQGHLQLTDPIKKYLPKLKQPWADTITIHQLLTHTHGITVLDKPLAFPAGSAFAYSQIGYQLLADIISKTSGKTFAELSMELFKLCGMKHTFHPGLKLHHQLAKGYIEQDGILQYESRSLENFVAAGSFISTAPDLVLWSECMHSGHLISAKAYQLMTTVYAHRNHPIFGTTHYGYGPTISQEGKLKIGQTGFAPGFVSMCYYYPESKTTVVMLENTAWHMENLKETFYYHTAVLGFLEAGL